MTEGRGMNRKDTIYRISKIKSKKIKFILKTKPIFEEMKYDVYYTYTVKFSGLLWGCHSDKDV